MKNDERRGGNNVLDGQSSLLRNSWEGGQYMG